jgi:hypothetical protein
MHRSHTKFGSVGSDAADIGSIALTLTARRPHP